MGSCLLRAKPCISGAVLTSAPWWGWRLLFCHNGFVFVFNFMGRWLSNVFCKDVAISSDFITDCLTATKPPPPPPKPTLKSLTYFRQNRLWLITARRSPNWCLWHCIIQRVCGSGQRSHLHRGQAFQRAKDISCEGPFVSRGDIKCLQNPLDETVSEVG